MHGLGIPVAPPLGPARGRGLRPVSRRLRPELAHLTTTLDHPPQALRACLPQGFSAFGHRPSTSHAKAFLPQALPTLCPQGSQAATGPLGPSGKANCKDSDEAFSAWARCGRVRKYGSVSECVGAGARAARAEPGAGLPKYVKDSEQSMIGPAWSMLTIYATTLGRYVSRYDSRYVSNVC